MVKNIKMHIQNTKTIIKIIPVLAVLALAGLFGLKLVLAAQGDVYTQSGINYVEDASGNYEVQGCAGTSCPNGVITIPQTVNGKTVTGVGVGAFCFWDSGEFWCGGAQNNADVSGITAIILPPTIDTLGDYAFSTNYDRSQVSSTNLQYIEFTGSARPTNIGNQVFNQVEANPDFYIKIPNGTFASYYDPNDYSLPWDWQSIIQRVMETGKAQVVTMSYNTPNPTSQNVCLYQGVTQIACVDGTAAAGTPYRDFSPYVTPGQTYEIYSEINHGSGLIDTNSQLVVDIGGTGMTMIDYTVRLTYHSGVSHSDTLNFGAVDQNYSPRTPQVVTVTNASKWIETGAITIEEQDRMGFPASNFSASPNAPASLAAGASFNLSIAPINGLTTGIYDSMINLRATNILMSNAITTYFKVNNPYRIAFQGSKVNSWYDPTNHEYNYELSMVEYYGYTPQPYTVDIVNTSDATLSTGDIDLQICDYLYNGTCQPSLDPLPFTFTPNSITSIAPGGSATFTVTPLAGLTRADCDWQTATYACYGMIVATAAGNPGISLTEMYYNFGVISKNWLDLSSADTGLVQWDVIPYYQYQFADDYVGYATKTLDVTITNMGSEDSGEITTSCYPDPNNKNGPDDCGKFSWPSTIISNLAPGASTTVTITVPAGLPAGEYTVAMMIDAANPDLEEDPDQVVVLDFKVLDCVGVCYDLAVTPDTNDVNFDTVAAGDPTDAQTMPFTIKNTGVNDLALATVTLSGSGFTLTGPGTLASQPTPQTIELYGLAAGMSQTFTVTPKASLAPGIYEADIVINYGSQTLTRHLWLSVLAPTPTNPPSPSAPGVPDTGSKLWGSVVKAISNNLVFIGVLSLAVLILIGHIIRRQIKQRK